MATSRAFAYRVDIAPDQYQAFARHAGTARRTWNWGLALRNAQVDAERAWLRQRSESETDGDIEAAKALRMDPKWRKVAYAHMPEEIRKPFLNEEGKKKGQRESLNYMSLGKMFTKESRRPDSDWSWWSAEEHGVSRFAVSDALRNLDKAFEAYYDPKRRPTRKERPRKDGRPAGWPRFKRKGGDSDGFAIFNLTSKRTVAGKKIDHPWGVVEDGHRIKVPNIGLIRVHDNTKRLRRAIKRGGIPKSARFTKRGGHWYVAIIVEMPALPDGHEYSPTGAPREQRPTRPQQIGGAVGVDIGVSKGNLVAYSNLDGAEGLVAGGRYGRASREKVRRLQRKASRQQGPRLEDGVRTKASKGWKQTQARIARLQHEAALRRESDLHGITKRLATGFAVVAIEDLSVKGMSARAKPKPDPENGNHFLPNRKRQKAGLNRAILDASPFELRRQLIYKTSWYGSRVHVVDRFAPTSKMCSACGTVKPKLSMGQRVFKCENCGLRLDRDINAARNLARLGRDAVPSTPDGGDVKRVTARVAPANGHARSPRRVRPSGPLLGSPVSGDRDIGAGDRPPIPIHRTRAS